MEAAPRYLDCSSLRDLLALTASQEATLRRSCLDNDGCVVYRFGRRLAKAELVRLTRCFGPPTVAPGYVTNVGHGASVSKRIAHLCTSPAPTVEEQVRAYLSIGEQPFVAVIGNADLKAFSFAEQASRTATAGAAAGAAGAAATPSSSEEEFNRAFSENEWTWHADMNYLARPVRFSLLYCDRPSQTGGATSFVSMMKPSERILRHPELACFATRRIKHNSTYTSAGMLRPGMRPPVDAKTSDGVWHPLFVELPAEYRDETSSSSSSSSSGGGIRGSSSNHSDSRAVKTKRRPPALIYPGRRPFAFLEGAADDAESDAVLDAMWQQILVPPRGDTEEEEDTGKGAGKGAGQEIMTHHWRVGDVAVMDNFVVLHYREPFPKEETRVVWRTQTLGDPPLVAAFPRRGSTTTTTTTTTRKASKL